MTALVAISTNTLRQLLGARRLIGMALLAALPALIFFLTTARQTESRTLDQFVQFALSLLFPIVVPVATLILATSALGDERRGSTMSFLTLRPIPRWLIAAAKLGAVWAAASAVAITSGLGLVAVYAIRTGDWSLLVPTVVGLVIAVALYTALFVPLGHLLERAIVVGLIYVFMWEGPITFAIDGLAASSPWRTGLSGFVALLPESTQRLGFDARDFLDASMGSLTAGAGGAALKATVAIALSILFIAWLLRRRDAV